MKIIKLSLVAGLSLAWFSSLNAAGIADIYWYEAKPGKVQEVEALMREGRDIAIASGQTTIVFELLLKKRWQIHMPQCRSK